MRALRPWIPALAWAATIFVLSSFPGTAYPATDLYQADKLVHLGLYGLLGLLCARGLLRGARAHHPWATWLIASALSTAYGMSDELHQRFVPGRNSDWRDVCADAAGSLLGAAVILLVARRQRRAGAGPVR